MGALVNLLHSEKAVTSGLLVLAASAMAMTGQITTEQWMDYTQTLLGIYIGGKTVQGAVSTIAGRKTAELAEQNKARASESLRQLSADVASNDARAVAALDEKFPRP
jgi:hypothetical protein